MFAVRRFASSRVVAAGAAKRVRAYTVTPALTQLSSLSEPDATLFKSYKLESSAPSTSYLDEQLRDDVRTMGSTLGQVIKDHDGTEVFDKVEHMRNLAKAWRAAGAGRDPEKAEEAAQVFEELTTFAASLPDEDLFLVSRAFTHFLAIANAAEGHHRSRKLAMEESTDKLHALSSRPDSCGGAIPSLAEEYDKNLLWDALTSQSVELVLTAHPTEVNRKTILNKNRRIHEILTKADGYRMTGRTTPYQQAQLNDALNREIASIWQSDEVSRVKPRPQDEAERGTLVVETVLWEAVPSFLRKLDATMETYLGKGLPFESAPIRFSSWMGGDRDGNPNVTANVTREVCLRKRLKGAKLFAKDIETLANALSITNCSDELRAVVGDAREPYRAYLTTIWQRLQNTISWCNESLDRLGEHVEGDNIYISKDEFMKDLLLVHRSLCETGNEVEARGFLTDILRNISAFGLVLVPLDIRQEADRHMEVLDAITRYLGFGSYAQWDEKAKVTWLTQQLASNRPFLRPGEWNDHPDIFSPEVAEALETFQAIAEQKEGSLNAHVISQATHASDVLAVLLLQRDAGVKKPLRVVPLFETLDDLNGACDTMKTLFSLPVYMGSINGKQEVMIGYSDSAKDAGRLAASWAQFETQEKLAVIAKEAGVEMTFFHGKGGTVGRGGNPATFNAIMAHAPGTINGRFRVTEQGEMITQNFGHGDRAERTMDIYTAAVLSEKCKDRPLPTQEWRDLMGKLSDISCAEYRRIVREDDRFVPYFRAATPELELTKLNIGSRPAKRKPGGGVESLRAIPWNFSWTQTRLNLPTWLGVGTAVNQLLKSEDGEKLKNMYKDWPSFRTTVDLVEMVLAKSEPAIASHYDNVLVKDPKAQELGEEVRQLHKDTEKAVLELSGHTKLSEDNKILSRALAVRNPYVDCLNVLQAETLKRMRATDKDEKILDDALMTTITGVANGMGNTG